MIVWHASAVFISIFFNQHTTIGHGSNKRDIEISRGKVAKKTNKKGDIAIALETRSSTYCTAAKAAATR